MAYMNNSEDNNLPNEVTVPVKELYYLRDRLAFLKSLEIAGIKEWSEYQKAIFIFEHDPDIIDIKLGWKTDF